MSQYPEEEMSLMYCLSMMNKESPTGDVCSVITTGVLWIYHWIIINRLTSLMKMAAYAF